MATRQAPPESANNFALGTKKRGNDGNMWVIIQTKSSKRWSKVNKLQKTKKILHKTNKKPKQTIKNKTTTNIISLEKLKQLNKKYNVITSGSKKIMAQNLWRIRGSTVASQDLELIFHLLDKSQQKKATQLINIRISKPISDYKGMYEVNKKPITSMTRDELIKNLQKFRDSWEKITTRNQDLSDERLKDETTDALRKLIKFYYSNNAKLLAEDWLRK